MMDRSSHSSQTALSICVVESVLLPCFHFNLSLTIFNYLCVSLALFLRYLSLYLSRSLSLSFSLSLFLSLFSPCVPASFSPSLVTFLYVAPSANEPDVANFILYEFWLI